MRKLMRNLKIKHKLIIIIMSIVVFSLVLVGSVLIVSERYQAKQSMADKLITVSHIVADRSTAAISFYDTKVAKELLQALDHESSIVRGCMYDQYKVLFATHGKDKSEPCPLKPKQEEYHFTGNRFELYQPIVLEGEIIGTVYIRATLDKLNYKLVQFISLVIIMITLTGFVAYFMAKKQQSIISKPILDLAEVARKISIDGNHTARLTMSANKMITKESDRNDEIGILNRAFNDMLKQIHKREVARDEAQKALSEREQDLIVTLNSIGDAVIATDVEGNVTRMNPVAEELTGWSYEDAKQQPLSKVFPIINTTTQEPIENPVGQVIKTGEIVYLSNHTTLISKNGKEINIADSAAPIRNNNEILGMILVFNDVTEQYKLREAAAKSERDLQAIMDNSPAAIHVEDGQGVVIFTNKQFDQLADMQGSNIVGKKLHDIFADDIANEMLSNGRSVIESENILEVEELVPQIDGEHYYTSIKFPLFDEEEKVYAVCSISTDITERKTQEEQLRRSQKMDALGKLTGGIAHDYNNLLGIIMGYAELLNEKLESTPELSKYALDIEHAAERGTKLTKKLLAFTRHKSSDEKLLDINGLLKEQKLMLEKTLTARINLKWDLASYLWPVWLDSGDLEDAVINMSINASHAIEGHGELIFKTKNKELSHSESQLIGVPAGDYVVLVITDNGSGMDDHIKEKIFDPFFSTKGERGTGLGLSQVYGFVKRSGGDIKVFTEENKGTSFELYFPRSFRSDNVSKRMVKIDKENLKGKETILVVDDEQSLVDLASDILSAQGYQVLKANGGVEALEIINNENISLMISDVIMPNMDGYELSEKVKSKYPEIKILLASGFVGEHDNKVIDNVLQENLLYKPYTASSLLESVRGLLDSVKTSEMNMIMEQALTYSGGNKDKRLIQNVEKDENKIKKILIMDDEIDVQDLFVLSLEMLGYKAITANNSDEALSIYEQSIASADNIDALILDLNIPGSLGGREVAKKIRNLNGNVKLIVCSGDTGSEEMTNYKEYGFDGALEKIFDRKIIKELLDKIL